MNKKKILNDPIYGFIKIPDGLIFNIIEHPYFQRLRRIKQLGLTDYVYPGAMHTRFHHALGAMHLMEQALLNLRSKGIEITEAEYEGALAAILLHDIGHGPFSHALEESLLQGIHHEQMSSLIIQLFNDIFDGRLRLALKIFNRQYQRLFFSQLVASQLDVDRLDYLNRDSYFTGVSEGKIGFDRILKMLNVWENEIVVEEKAIYSIENFLSSRRLMYWQVYLHKTTVGTEKLLIQLIKRAKFLAQAGELKTMNDALRPFLQNNYSLADFKNDPKLLHVYLSLDDHDIWGSVKIWKYHDDPVLSELSRMLIERDLFRVLMKNTPHQWSARQELLEKVGRQFSIPPPDAKYFVVDGFMSNAAYEMNQSTINVMMKDGSIVDIASASDLPNIKAMSKIVRKYYLCWPKIVSL
ncbi:MAG: HD domain-containing protein [Cyclobacteriaceae bacterium]|nr:HD domain-containing protein [Cyclobacteriaceae bacterium]